ncbi:hypothetical protein [Amycolatopsis sp. H20-H5]|uniref:hypothetical protein n=1 Tax=Amycolatopsis sp. H20-H5 TaxID=3046309 RepID=UPI002DBBE863|nr:hypothetical protein [Amycolatopsis sp. H20-H5]MEC3982836.1 hypothetical protein [Amycolatopsis sp. H20-H5]
MALLAVMCLACGGVGFVLGAHDPWASGTIDVAGALGGRLVEGLDHRRTSQQSK